MEGLIEAIKSNDLVAARKLFAEAMAARTIDLIKDPCIELYSTLPFASRFAFKMFKIFDKNPEPIYNFPFNSALIFLVVSTFFSSSGHSYPYPLNSIKKFILQQKHYRF